MRGCPVPQPALVTGVKLISRSQNHHMPIVACHTHVPRPFHMSYFTNTTMALVTVVKLISRSLHMSYPCHAPAIKHYISLALLLVTGVKLISRSVPISSCSSPVIKQSPVSPQSFPCHIIIVKFSCNFSQVTLLPAPANTCKGSSPALPQGAR